MDQPGQHRSRLAAGTGASVPTYGTDMCCFLVDAVFDMYTPITLSLSENGYYVGKHVQ